MRQRDRLPRPALLVNPRALAYNPREADIYDSVSAWISWPSATRPLLARASLGTTTREARYYGDQGCIIDNPRTPGIHFTPTPVQTTLPAAETQAWPMGDRVDAAAPPARVDRAKLDAAVAAAFADPDAMTAAFLVVHKGRIVAERYALGITRDTQLESWSMG